MQKMLKIIEFQSEPYRWTSIEEAALFPTASLSFSAAFFRVNGVMAKKVHFQLKISFNLLEMQPSSNSSVSIEYGSSDAGFAAFFFGGTADSSVASLSSGISSSSSPSSSSPVWFFRRFWGSFSSGSLRSAGFLKYRFKMYDRKISNIIYYIWPLWNTHSSPDHRHFRRLRATPFWTNGFSQRRSTNGSASPKDEPWRAWSTVGQLLIFLQQTIKCSLDLLLVRTLLVKRPQIGVFLANEPTRLVGQFRFDVFGKFDVLGEKLGREKLVAEEVQQ